MTAGIVWSCMDLVAIRTLDEKAHAQELRGQEQYQYAHAGNSDGAAPIRRGKSKTANPAKTLKSGQPISLIDCPRHPKHSSPASRHHRPHPEIPSKHTPCRSDESTSRG